MHAAEQAGDQQLVAALGAMQESLPVALDNCLAQGTLQTALACRDAAGDSLALQCATLQHRLQQLTQVPPAAA